MKLLQIISLSTILIFLMSCQEPTHQNNAKEEAFVVNPDPADTKGTGPGAVKVLEFAESALQNITSLHAKVVSTKDSDMYGHEKVYTGDIKAEFGGKPGSLGNRWYESKQSAKGRDKHIRGTVTENGMKELHLLKKKVVAGGKDASPAAMIAFDFYSVFSDENYFTRMKDYSSDTLYANRGLIYNVMLEGVEDILGRKCFVVKSVHPEMPDRLITRAYFGVEDGLYYGESTEVNTEDGNQISKTLFSELNINQPLPSFELEVPEDFAVERYVAPWDQKSLEVGIMAPDWALIDSEGNEQKLSDYRGQLVLMDFWATWCGPCKAKMPHIQEIHEEFKGKGLKVISILSGDKGHEKQAKKYIEDHNYTFDLVYGNEDLGNQYKIRFLPTVIVVDQNGKIIHLRDTPGINDNVNEEEELHDVITKNIKIGI